MVRDYELKFVTRSVDVEDTVRSGENPRSNAGHNVHDRYPLRLSIVESFRERQAAFSQGGCRSVADRLAEPSVSLSSPWAGGIASGQEMEWAIQERDTS